MKRLVKISSSIIALAIFPVLSACARENKSFDDVKLTADEPVIYTFKDVTVHDPSVIRVDDTYYIFGSHLAGAKSTDLMNWEMIGNGVNKTNPIIPDAMTEMSEAFTWAKTDTFWAPDVVQLEDGRFYMYYCNCEGRSPLSALGVAVSDHVEGPYRDLGIILKSGMSGESENPGEPYDARVHPNAIDPHVFFDNEGRLWMLYGSYSGGIYALELDTQTGFPLERGYGTKILGMNHLRIEGPYVIYNPDTEYYYMFLSYGGLAVNDGYNIRVCRSKNPDGPYYDAKGIDMIECQGLPGSFFNDQDAEKYGTKLMGNYKWQWREGELGESRLALKSPGHNSAIYQEETGKYFIIFHTRFEKSGEYHSVRTHQFFFNDDGWPVIVPYRYVGEIIGEYKKSDVVGIYKYINHGTEITNEIMYSKEIILQPNGKVTGPIVGNPDNTAAEVGSWKLTGKNKLELTMYGNTYKGVFCIAYDEFGRKYVMTFTAMSDEGVSIWGSGLQAVDKDW